MTSNDKKTRPTSDNVTDRPKFGRLLIILVLAVALIVVITLASESFYTN